MSNNKTAIITGGSTGIGKNISILLSQHQYDIILISRNKDSLELVKEEIKRAGTECSMPYVSNRWLGGTLSNNATIS